MLITWYEFTTIIPRRYINPAKTFLKFIILFGLEHSGRSRIKESFIDIIKKSDRRYQKIRFETLEFG